MRWSTSTALLLALGLSLCACESRSSEPAPTQPQEPATPAPPPAREPPPNAAGELPQIAGVHYLEFVTGGADANSALPMIVAIHGLGDSPEGFRSWLEDFDRPARFILPRALDPHEGGWSWFPLRARSEDVEGLAAGIAHAADVLAPAIAQLSSTRPTRGKPIITGFSQGGMLSFALAIEHGELASLALPIGGWLPPPLWPTPAPDKPVAPPIIAFNGDADVAVRYEPTKLAVEQLQRLGYDAQLRTYPGVGHMISPEIRAEVFAAMHEQLAKIE